MEQKEEKKDDAVAELNFGNEEVFSMNMLRNDLRTEVFATYENLCDMVATSRLSVGDVNNYFIALRHKNLREIEKELRSMKFTRDVKFQQVAVNLYTSFECLNAIESQHGINRLCKKIRSVR